MSKIDDIYNFMKKFDLGNETKQILNDNARIIKQWQTERLYNKGFYSDGRKIKTYRAKQGNVYAMFTIKRKLASGQPFDRVTLNNSGQFYKSIIVRSNKSILEIKANWKKKSGLISFNLDTDKVLGLTNYDRIELKDILMYRLNKAMKNGR